MAVDGVGGDLWAEQREVMTFHTQPAKPHNWWATIMHKAHGWWATILGKAKRSRLTSLYVVPGFSI